MNTKNKWLTIGAGGALALMLSFGGYFLLTKKSPEQLDYLCSKGKPEVQVHACADLCEITDDDAVCLRGVVARATVASEAEKKSASFNFELAKDYERYCDSTDKGKESCGAAAVSYAIAGKFEAARLVLRRACVEEKAVWTDGKDIEWTDFQYAMSCGKYNGMVLMWHTLSDPTIGQWAHDLVDRMNDLGK